MTSGSSSTPRSLPSRPWSGTGPTTGHVNGLLNVLTTGCRLIDIPSKLPLP